MYSEISLFAMDKDAKKLGKISPSIPILSGDAANPPLKDEVFDSILVDAPCSSLGVVRKHPEIKWRRKEKEIKAFGKIQAAILEGLWRCLKKGGTLVYSVCSFEPEETSGVLEAFAIKEQFLLENPLPFLFNKEYFQSVPHESGMDGFFIARLKKA